jgi:hypothetical protein
MSKKPGDWSMAIKTKKKSMKTCPFKTKTEISGILVCRYGGYKEGSDYLFYYDYCVGEDKCPIMKK